ncbi:MAG: type II toxin-antitoxin system VapC family toxin [Candidatus Saccharimonadales bacterium]
MNHLLALDTNAYRALDDGNPIIARLVKTAASLALPSPVVGEIYYGIFNGTKTSYNLARLKHFLENPRLTSLQIDGVTCRIYGEIATQLRRAGRPIQQNDIWIAALCKQHGYILATRDTDFSAIIGLETIRF